MLKRRDFIIQTAASSGLVAMQGSSTVSAIEDARSARKSLRILILGATGHIGPHFVRAALARGHHVSALVRKPENRKPNFVPLPTPAALPETVERLVGDRNGDLASIQRRDWDAVLDLVTWGPLWIKTLGEALSGRVRHFTFISTADVYVGMANPNADGTGVINERSPVVAYTGTLDPYSPVLTQPGDPSYQYGALKALCEREAEEQFPGKTLIVRPPYIVGPNESVGAFSYLAWRMTRGGEMLVAGDPLGHVELIDVRDLAEWTIRMAEQADTGIFNASGPALPMGWAELLGAVRGTLSQPVTLRWVSREWVVEQKLVKGEWNHFLFWPHFSQYPEVSNTKARSRGLTFRPMGVTASDTLAWFQHEPEDLRQQLLGRVEDSMAIEAQLLKAWRAQHSNGKSAA